jgi:hypothetical protein
MSQMYNQVLSHLKSPEYLLEQQKLYQDRKAHKMRREQMGLLTGGLAASAPIMGQPLPDYSSLSLASVPSQYADELSQMMAPKPSFLSGVGSSIANTARDARSSLSKTSDRFLSDPSAATRLSSLGAALLTGPQRTPVSFGASLAQGIKAGNIAAQEEAARKRKLLIEELKAKKNVGSLAGQKTSPKTYLTVDDDGNKKIIETYFDKITGVRRVSGTNEPVPSGSLELSSTDSPDISYLSKLESSVYEDESRLKALDSYLNDVEGSAQGINNLIDRASTKIKTLIDDGELTEAELKTARGQAKLQGLLGNFRIDIVGVGVMTEQDALRILAALGGDFNAFQNKQVTKDLILELRKKTSSRYKREAEKFNRALKGLPDVSFAKEIYRPIELYNNTTGGDTDGDTGNGRERTVEDILNDPRYKN